MTERTWEPGDGSLADRLTLADWRRRVAELYVDVRGMAGSDPAVALAHWRAVRERLYREHPQSPVPLADRSAFRASHFEHDPSLRFRATVDPAPAADPGAPALRSLVRPPDAIRAVGRAGAALRRGTSDEPKVPPDPGPPARADAPWSSRMM